VPTRRSRAPMRTRGVVDDAHLRGVACWRVRTASSTCRIAGLRGGRRLLIPPRGAAFAETVPGARDPRRCCGQRRVVVGLPHGARRGASGPEVVQQPGADGLGQLGVGRSPPSAADDDPPTVGDSRVSTHARGGAVQTLHEPVRVGRVRGGRGGRSSATITGRPSSRPRLGSPTAAPRAGSQGAAKRWPRSPRWIPAWPGDGGWPP
jgi:hypothetical protein